MNRLISCFRTFQVKLCSEPHELMIHFSYEKLSSTLDTLRKTSSEPCLLSELIVRPIYRSEEMEFVVQLDDVSYVGKFY